MENTTLTFEQALENFLTLTKEASDAYYAKNYPSLTPDIFEALEGPKYVKIIRKQPNGSGGSAHLFILKATGDILKAASYKAPAKGVRGNIYNPEPLKGTNPHGANYNNGYVSHNAY